MLVNYYRTFTPGLNVCAHPTVVLGKNIVQPHVAAQFASGPETQSQIDERGMIVGPPNLVCEIFPRYGLEGYEDKCRLYERAGVKEFIAWQVGQEIFIWHRLNSDGVYEMVEEDVPNMIKSVALPGFWIRNAAFRDRNWQKLFLTIDEGTQSPEHEAMVGKIIN